MEVLLTKDVSGLGKSGQIVDVSAGYADNFLFRKKLAVLATIAIKHKLQTEARDKEGKRKRQEDHFFALKAQIEKRSFTIKAKVGEQGKLFGAIREKDIAEVVSSKLAEVVDKHQVTIPSPIRTTGEHTVELKLHPNITANVKINIEPQ